VENKFFFFFFFFFLTMVKSILYEETIALGTGVDFGKGLGRSKP